MDRTELQALGDFARDLLGVDSLDAGIRALSAFVESDVQLQLERNRVKLTPAQRETSLRIFREHGRAAFDAHLAALPVNPVMQRAIANEEPAPDARSPRDIAAGAQRDAFGAMTPMERHAWIQTHGIKAYRAAMGTDR